MRHAHIISEIGVSNALALLFDEAFLAKKLAGGCIHSPARVTRSPRISTARSRRGPHG